MAQILRQSTQVKVVIGPVVAVANGYVPVTTLDLSTADEAELLKHDAGSVTDISGATFAAITGADGYYNLTLTTSHTDTCGMITVLINDDSLCLPVKATFQVIEEAVYDALFAASATGALPVSTGGIAAAAFAAGAIDAAAIANGAIDAATFAADVDAEILSYLVDDATRIDASALNTASGAIGSNGSGLTEAGGDGDHLTAINLPNQTMDIVGNITGNLSGSVGSVTGAVGSVTGNVGGNVTGSVGSVVGAVGSVTGNVGGNVTGSVGSVAGAVGSVIGNVGGNVTGSVGSLATQAKADVNAEVLDVLNVDTFAQPGQENPAATTTLSKMLAYLYKAWRNKSTQTSSEYALYADDGTTKDQEAACSDDATTFTKGEVGTGA